MKTGGQILAVWSANASAVYMGFSGTPQTLANVTADNPLQKDNFFNNVFSTMGNGSFDAAASDPFRGLLGAPGQDGLLSVTFPLRACKYHCNYPVHLTLAFYPCCLWAAGLHAKRHLHKGCLFKPDIPLQLCVISDRHHPKNGASGSISIGFHGALPNVAGDPQRVRRRPAS